MDARIVNEVQTKTGRIISSQTQVGGFPALAVNQRVYQPPPNPNAITPGGFRTNLELDLERLALQLEGVQLTQAPTMSAIIAPPDAPAWLFTDYLVRTYTVTPTGDVLVPLATTRLT